jgi:sugar transferase (PEP-CTERM/EpsH1 system associated)
VRILFLTPRFPYPPLKGDTLRAYHQIRALHDAGHSVTLLSLADAPVSNDHLAEMQRLCTRVEIVPLPKARALLNMGLGVFSTRPLQVSHYLSSRFRQLLAAHLAEEQYDAVHVALIRMLPYVWHFNHAYPPVVVDLIDSLALNLEARRKSARGLLKLAYELEYRRVRRYEQETIHRFPALAVSSPADKEAMGGDAIAVIPNGVDLDRFPFEPTEGRDPGTLIFTGNMGYGPNEEAVIWFAGEVWPMLRQAHPHLRFLVVGTNPGERIEGIGRETPGILVLGQVPDVGEYLGKATLAVAPMRSGSGIQNKVLEAMSAGAPVITTSIGNRGVGAQHPHHLLVADTPHDFARAIATLLESPQERAKLAQAGRAYVEQHFRWEEHAGKLTQLYQSAQFRISDFGFRIVPELTAQNPKSEIRNPKLHVMQMTDVTGRGGAEKALDDIALHLDRGRFDVSVCATRSAGNYQPSLDEAGVRTFVQGRASRWDLRQWLQLVRLMKRERVDILHTHLFGSNTLGRLLGRLAGVPVIISHEHWSTISPREARIDRMLYRFSDRVLVPSQASKSLVSKVEGIPPHRIDVLYNGVDTTRLTPPTSEERADARREFGIPNDALLVGMLGRLSPEKGGVDHLLKAIYRLAEDHPNTYLLIVGDGPTRSALEKLNAELDGGRWTVDGGRQPTSISQLTLEDNRPPSTVLFAGSRQDVPRLLGAMDLFVLPSLHEALPLVLLEAMAVGLPLVATCVGGVPEIVEHDINGLLVPPGDEDALLAALRQLAGNAELRTRLGEAGLKRVRAEFTIQGMVRRVEAIYEELYARKAGERRPYRTRHSPLATRHSPYKALGEEVWK